MMMMAQACEACGKLPLGWPEAFMWAMVAMAAAYLFATLARNL